MPKIKDIFDLIAAGSGDSKSDAANPAEEYRAALFQAIRDATTARECYQVLFDFVIANAPDTKFIFSDLQYLRRGDMDGTRTAYSLNDAGRAEFRRRKLHEKISVLKKWGGVTDVNPDATADDQLATAIGTVDGRLTAKRAEILATPDGALIDRLRHVKGASRAKITQWIFGTTVNVGQAIEGLPEVHRLPVIRQIVLSCGRRTARRASESANKNRAATIITAFTEAGLPVDGLAALANPPGNSKFYQQVYAILAGRWAAQLDAIRNILQTRTAITFDDPADVLEPALERYQFFLEQSLGVRALDAALADNFNEQSKVNDLIRDLIGEVEYAFDLLPLKMKDNSFARVKLHPIDIWDLLLPTRVGVTVDATRDSTHRPLIDLSAAGSIAFTRADALYFVDLAQPLIARYENWVVNFAEFSITVGAVKMEYDRTVDAQRRAFKAKITERWGDFGFNLRYNWFALYSILTNGQSRSNLLWYVVARGGHGIGRADPVATADYIWSYRGMGQLDRLGELFGLDPTRNIDVLNVRRGDFEILRAGTADAKDPAFLEYTTVRASDARYVRCNGPGNGVGPKSSGTGLAAETNPINYNFNFDYFRKIDEADRVLKSGDSPHRPNRNDLIPDEGMVAVSPPIDFRSSKNFERFRTHKSSRAVIKNKGNDLFSNTAPRLQAGSVMAGIYDYFRHNAQVRPGYLSATEFTEVILANDASSLRDWQQLRNIDAVALRVDEEWCHLRGHGDKGQERVGNFAAGSFHCNTEQLAIESGQRLTTYNLPEGTFILKSTAYLLENSAMETDAGNYTTQTDQQYKEMAYGLNEKRWTSKKRSAPQPDSELKRLAQTAPIAAFIRYKVYRRGGTALAPTYEKFLDYIFEGQSEFFDQNQYRILNAYTRFLLQGPAAFEAWYAEKVSEL